MAGPWTPLLVFVLAAAESAAFMGLFVPGELAVILGGVAAGTGSVSLWLVIPASVAGAIAGDSIGYRLGKTVGPSLLHRPQLGKLVRQMDRAGTLLAQRGWWALVVARFASVLRAVVPFAAGMGNMTYRRFLLGNVIGGVAWGTTFTLVGYLAGSNYPRVERWFRTGGLAVAGIGLLIAAIVWFTRWAQRNQEAVLQAVHRFTRTRPIQRFTGLAGRPQLSGITLALTATAIIGGAWLFGGLVQDVLGSEEFFFFDLTTIRYLAEHPTDQLVAVARAVNVATDARLMILLVLAAAGAFMIRGSRRRALALLAAVAGQWAIVEMTASLVDRMPPDAMPLAPRLDYGFPSAHVALFATVAVATAWASRRAGWQATVRHHGIAALALATVGASRVILLIEYPSDTIAAVAVAVAWTLTINLALTPSKKRPDD